MRIALVLALIPVLLGSAPAGEKAAATYFTEDSVGDVRLGQLGLQRAHSAAVRELAQTMVRDHTMTAHAGLRVAQAIGDEEAQLKPGDDNEILLSYLQRFTGPEFEREYVKAMIKAHQADIETAQNALEYARTPALRTYLHTAIAIDEKHLKMAQAAAKE